jgi:outer membrane protein TolC
MLPGIIKFNRIRVFVIVIFIINSQYNHLNSQSDILTLDKAIEAAVEKQPLNKQKSLISDKTALQIEYLKKQQLPQINLTAKATLQSENIDLEFPIPNVDPISLPLYKANTDIDASYSLYDGGLNKTLQKNEELKGDLAKISIETKLFSVKTRVVDLYYSILTLGKQKEILDSSLSILKVKSGKVKTAIDNGVALKSDMDKIELEKIKLKKNIATIQNNINTLRLLLSDITGIDMKNKILSDNDIGDYEKNWSSRPEYKFFSMNSLILEQSKQLIVAKNKPKVILFARAGIGYPNPFNIFNDNIAPYAIGGIKFSWNFWDWKKSSIEEQKLDIEKFIVENKKEIFDENMKIETNKLYSQIEGLENNLHFDNEIIQKQNDLIRTVENQYKNGTATINDLLVELTKKRISEINAVIHTIKIEKLKYKLKIILGK